MPDNESNDFKYYAFISYSRFDNSAAAYLQKNLEKFRFPVKLVSKENRPNHKKFIRPVFRDRRDLKNTESSFTEDIRSALQDTHYLIVLCSPRSAASEWVNKEILHFLETHDNDLSKVIPVILEGRPGCGTMEECLPSALRCDAITSRNLPSMISDDGEPEKQGWENGLVQTLSYALKVEREKIKASVDAEKLRQFKIYTAIGISVAIVFALLTAWAVRAERIADANVKRAEAAEQKTALQRNIAISEKERAEKAEKIAVAAKVRAERSEEEAKKQRDIAVDAREKAEVAEKNAKYQAEIAKEQLEFIGAVFRSANPNLHNGNRRVTVWEIMKNASSDIMDDSNVIHLQNLAVKAALADLFGGIYLDCKEYLMAEKLYMFSAIAKKKNNENFNSIASSLYGVARCKFHSGEHDNAKELLVEILKEYRQLPEEEQCYETIAMCHNELGCIFEIEQEFDNAINNFNKTIDFYELATKQNDKYNFSYEKIMAAMNIGIIQRQLKDTLEAKQYLLKALQWIKQEQRNSENDISLYKKEEMHIARQVSLLYAGEGNFDEAEKKMKPVVIYWKQKAETDRMYIEDLMNVSFELGWIQMQKKAYKDAVESFNIALKHSETIKFGNSESAKRINAVISHLCGLILIIEKLDIEKGKKMQQDALEWAKNNPEHPTAKQIISAMKGVK